MSDTSATAARHWPGLTAAGSLLRVRGWRNLADRKHRGSGLAWLLCPILLVFAAGELRAETTIYVGKHFEVREHDAPVKYVFNGSTRVARITGSLSANERIQRLRLRAGWNLISLAVAAPDFLGQLREFTSGPAPVIKALYRWQPGTRDYGTIASGESVAAGTVLWVSAQTDAVVAVRGEYVEPSQWGAPGGETFVATPALEAQPLTLPAGVTVWRYDAPNGRWQAGLTGDLASLSDLPSALAPGEAIYIHSNEPADLGAPAPEQRLRYYHQDHLGSSSVMTDAGGAPVEETAFYPFGTPRHEHRLRQVEEAYKFTQKERDRESGLHYFEARYVTAGLARFAVPDPKYAHPDTLVEADAEEFFSTPQKLNQYAYARNNPLNYVDPAGLDEEGSGGSLLDAARRLAEFGPPKEYLRSQYTGPSIEDIISKMVERGRSISDSYPAMVKQYKENVCAAERRVLWDVGRESVHAANRENCELAKSVAKQSCKIARLERNPKAAGICVQADVEAQKRCDAPYKGLKEASEALEACLKRNNAFEERTLEDLSRAHDDYRRQLSDALQK